MKLNFIKSPKGEMDYRNLGITAKKRFNVKSVKIGSPVYSTRLGTSFKWDSEN